MELQIMGRKNCRETRRVERYFKERGIDFQFRDLIDKGLSSGELDNICRDHSPGDLIDTEGKAYSKGGYSYLEYDPAEEILEHPDLLITPIVRWKHLVSVGRDEDAWSRIAEALRS